MNDFPTCAPSELEVRPAAQAWLVDTLRHEQGVGIVGGEPKCGKTFLALHIAVAVAAGVPCMGRFPAQPGGVLLFAAEDAPHVLRQRLEAVAAASGADLQSLDLRVLDVPTLRLDDPEHRRRLERTVQRIRPRLLVLDPLVRLHGADENAVREIAPILDRLRRIQRAFHTAVLVVHHARKGGGARPGQALRGSGEIFAWSDNVLVMRRQRDRILLASDHRAAANLRDLALEIAVRSEGPALRIAEPNAAAHRRTAANPRERIRDILRDAGRPLSRRRIREAAKMRAETVGDALGQLAEAGDVIHDRDGYQLRDQDQPVPAPRNPP